MKMNERTLRCCVQLGSQRRALLNKWRMTPPGLLTLRISPRQQHISSPAFPDARLGEKPPQSEVFPMLGTENETTADADSTESKRSAWLPVVKQRCTTCMRARMAAGPIASQLISAAVYSSSDRRPITDAGKMYVGRRLCLFLSGCAGTHRCRYKAAREQYRSSGLMGPVLRWLSWNLFCPFC